MANLLPWCTAPHRVGVKGVFSQIPSFFFS